MISASSIVFYLIALFTLTNAVLAVTTRMIFRAAIFLLFTLVGIAGLYFWMENNFMAAVQIVVYVGGIIVLIIFSIFLTQQNGEAMPTVGLGRKIFSALAAFCGFALILNTLATYPFTITQNNHNIEIERIGMQLLDIQKTGFVLPFEAVSMLLLAAMIGCIVIALKQKPDEY